MLDWIDAIIISLAILGGFLILSVYLYCVNMGHPLCGMVIFSFLVGIFVKLAIRY